MASGNAVSTHIPATRSRREVRVTAQKSSRFDLRRVFRLPLLSAGEGTVPHSPTETEVLFDLTGENPENRLFGRHTPAEVRALLERSGLLRGIAERGYPDPTLLLSCADPADQRICLFAGARSRDRLLLEARFQLPNFHLRHPIGPFPEGRSFRMLVINWLILSHPDGKFTVDRPRLPGQERPGLGLLDELLEFLKAFARDLSVDSVLDVPDHFHTALFYSRAFRYLDPAVEGTFRAIARDVASLPLALASDAIREGCLVERATGAPLAWPTAEQLLPTRGELRRFLRSKGYAEARDRAAGGLQVAVDWDLYREKVAARGAR
jgi:hypothetical protein